MKTQRFAVILVALNVLLLASTFRANSAPSSGNEAPVLRGRALELVDDMGRVRCEIKLHPADPNVKMPDGTKGYPESILLRLIDSEGAPNVKIAATEEGRSAGRSEVI